IGIRIGIRIKIGIKIRIKIRIRIKIGIRIRMTVMGQEHLLGGQEYHRPLEAVLAASPCSQALYLSLACSCSARGPSSSPRMIDFRGGSRWGQDVPSLLGCTRSTLKQGTRSGR